MVEVVHRLHEAVVQLADDVGLRHLHVVERDEGGSTGPHTFRVAVSLEWNMAVIRVRRTRALSALSLKDTIRTFLKPAKVPVHSIFRVSMPGIDLSMRSMLRPFLGCCHRMPKTRHNLVVDLFFQTNPNFPQSSQQQSFRLQTSHAQKWNWVLASGGSPEVQSAQ